MASNAGLTSLLWTLFFTAALCQPYTPGVENRDAIEGETIRLPCRFNPSLVRNTHSTIVYFWQKTTAKTGQDLAVINSDTLVKDYALESNPQEGRYDLRIDAARYERDNGQFECRIKESGSGNVVLSQTYVVTILIPPTGPPRITTSSPVAKEGEMFHMTCASEGGSPDPEIRWYRDGVPLQGKITNGGSRDAPTTNVLSIKPTINDDRALYTCTVWNRAIREEQKQSAAYSLTVHYVPRVKASPNPLNVLQGSDAFMSCTVDANPPVKKVRWEKNGRLVSQEPNHTVVNVGPNDSGIYSCIADNGVTDHQGHPGRGDLELSVQYGPTVSVIAEREASAGESISVQCNVQSNPPAHTVVWTREDDREFRQSGEILTLERIAPEETGKYICSATNNLRPSGASTGIERTANASVYVQVKHKPGTSEITPANPTAISGRPFKLMCNAKPAGYPKAEYRWWREGNEKNELSRQQVLNFQAVHVSQEGRYYCQSFNALGKGSVGSVFLTIEEPPSLVIPMPPSHIKKAGEKTGFSLTCRARGKPKPTVRWLHNNEDISAENGLYRIETRESIEDANVYVLQSVLHFESGQTRNNAVATAEAGRYSCLFDNSIGASAQSTTILNVEHSPIVRHNYNKVAFDLHENASIQCKMSAYPAPNFEWYFQGRLLDSYNHRYRFNVSDLGENVHAGTLTIANARADDYGDYTCRSWNSVGDDDEKTIIKLVKKSAPDAPSQLEAVEIQSDSVSLRWREEFNGGFSTEFIISYQSASEADGWRNESCRSHNPCRITGLESRHDYRFKVLAVNFRGQSGFSEELVVTTKINLRDMPMPYDAFFNQEQNILTFRVDLSAVRERLVAKVDVKEGTATEWLALAVVPINNEFEEAYLKPSANGYSDMRIQICLDSNNTWCGYESPLPVSNGTFVRESKGFTLETFMMVIFIGSLIAVLGVIFLLCCCCYRRRLSIEKKGDVEESERNKVNISSPYKGLGIGDLSDPNKMSSLPIYATSAGGLNHVAQNYYLTEHHGGNDPSPGASNETAQSDLWKSEIGVSDHGQAEMQMAYHYHNGQLDPHNQGYQYNTYYHQDDYAHNLEENLKNSLYTPFYDENPVVSHGHYGTAAQPNGFLDHQIDPAAGSGMVMEPNGLASPMVDPNSVVEQQYGSHRQSGRVIREIIV